MNIVKRRKEGQTDWLGVNVIRCLATLAIGTQNWLRKVRYRYEICTNKRKQVGKNMVLAYSEPKTKRKYNSNKSDLP